ncbi:flagellar hook-associated protein FlgK [Acetobacter persici]|uniref:Flagellar hook-associated protein 1 n=1 Tax=Acetobacter persici TaxID=1076596 RepID=A0A1U9LIY0_9PROT|nr:flagellar hook-associated protein FlgK [Acetobacter persici]AQT06348.1 flagellar hook-associated protein FlgK [Acetobacter persici]
MGLNASLSIANSGLHSIESQLAVVSENVSNSGTPGYVQETAVVESAVTGGDGAGVINGNTALSVSPFLQKALYTQNAEVSGLTVESNSLASLSAVQGTTTSSSDSSGTDSTANTLTDLLQNVSSALTSLTATPNQSASQASVVSYAQSLTDNIHTLASVYQTQRQSAEDSIGTAVSGVNTDLTSIGQISQKIMAVKAGGGDTASLENQRYEAMNDLSSKLGVQYTEKSNGDMVVRTQDGTIIPTRPDQINQNDSTQKLPSSTWPLITSSENISSSMYYKAGDAQSIPGIMLGDKDITSHLTGGTLGANITLRDATYPKMQAQLDSFSYTLINRFSSAGLPLFTNGTSSPLSGDTQKTTPNGIVGLSSAISVNATYAAKPSLLTTDASGNTGVTSTITSALQNAFGTSTDDTTGAMSSPTSKLGPDGGISISYSGSQGLSELATSLTTDQASVIANASSNLTSATSMKTTLSTKVANVSSVDVNSQMADVVTLQNAYTANAKVVSAVQSMFTALLGAIN